MDDVDWEVVRASNCHKDTRNSSAYDIHLHTFQSGGPLTCDFSDMNCVTLLSNGTIDRVVTIGLPDELGAVRALKAANVCGVFSSFVMIENDTIRIQIIDNVTRVTGLASVDERVRV